MMAIRVVYWIITFLIKDLPLFLLYFFLLLLDIHFKIIEIFLSFTYLLNYFMIYFVLDPITRKLLIDHSELS